MTEGKAIALICRYDCTLKASRSDVLVICSERHNFQYTIPVRMLGQIEQADFEDFLSTGRGKRNLPGAYRDLHSR